MSDSKLPLNPYIGDVIDRDAPLGDELLRMTRELTPKWSGMLDNYGIEYEIHNDACARAETDLFQESYEEFCEGKGHDGWIGTVWDDPNSNRGCTWQGSTPLLCYNPEENQEQCCLSQRAREFDLPDNCEHWNSPSPPCAMKEAINLTCDGQYLDYSRGKCDSVFRGTASTRGDSCISYFSQFPQYIDPRNFHLNIPDYLNIGLSPYDKTFIKRCNEWMDAKPEDKVQVMSAACNNAEVLEEEFNTKEAEGKVGPCSEWCRQNPGKCDLGAGDFCSQKITDICGSSSNNSICVDFIPSFCSCLYWSQHDMPQPQCYSPTCQAGRDGGQPGYKTAAMDMSLDGSACGQYCKQVIDLAAQNDLTLAGEIEQDCILIQDNMAKESTKKNGSVSTGGTGTNTSGNVNLDGEELFSAEWFKENQTIVIAAAAILFFVFVIIIALMAGGNNQGNYAPRFRMPFRRQPRRQPPRPQPALGPQQF